MKALLITGETYPNRHALRAAGCIWNRDEAGYLVARDRAERARAVVASTSGLIVTEIETDESKLVPLTGEALRAYRQDRQDRYAARLRARADAADRRAAQAHNRISDGERDFLRLGEPIKVGHHSEGRHRRLISRFNAAFDAEMSERSAAAELHQRADWVQPARIAGDAERERKARAAAADAVIRLHTVVNDPCYGDCIVTKINTNTYTAHAIGRGFTVTVQKHWARFVRQGSAADVPSRKYKVGDRVIASRLLAKYHGTVKRLTSRGYSIEYEWTSGRSRVDTFAECDLTPDQPAQG